LAALPADTVPGAEASDTADGVAVAAAVAVPVPAALTAAVGWYAVADSLDVPTGRGSTTSYAVTVTVTA
jgi:hypothetical protein